VDPRAALHPVETSGALAAAGDMTKSQAGPIRRPPGTAGFTLFRLTDPKMNTAVLRPPFDQVLVQSAKPVSGAVYDLLSVAVRNGTGQTFDANSGFSVRVKTLAPTYPHQTRTAPARSLGSPAVSVRELRRRHETPTGRNRNCRAVRCPIKGAGP
jgi:hypothetical protein